VTDNLQLTIYSKKPVHMCSG